MSDQKQTTMKAHNVRLSHEDPAKSIQSAIDACESKGHEVLQYIAVGSHAGVILARHERSAADEAPPQPEPQVAPAAAVPAEPEPAAAQPKPVQKQNKKGARR